MKLPFISCSLHYIISYTSDNMTWRYWAKSCLLLLESLEVIGSALHERIHHGVEKVKSTLTPVSLFDGKIATYF